LEELLKKNIKLPVAGNWEWESAWAVQTEKGDDDGWIYAGDFSKPDSEWKDANGRGCSVRRRRHFRTRMCKTLDNKVSKKASKHATSAFMVKT
jgi:hypothetical protein